MDIIGIANRVQSLLFQPRLDDDFSDRLNYRYTVGLLVLFSVIILTRQSSTDANIKCWVPAHFTKSYDEYVSRICWVSNTYHVDDNENIPKDEIERRQNQIKYYQWVIFILAFQAVLFFFPRIFWKATSVRSGIDISDLVEAANNYKAADKFETREKFMNYLVSNIAQYVDDPRRSDKHRTENICKHCISALIPCAGRFLGNYLVILYFIIKIMFLLNSILQMGVLSALLGYNFLFFGIDFIQSLAQGKGWITESKYFPKTAFCDFSIREIGNPQKNHRYTVQCVLSINLFNQQVFIIIWFWYILVIIANTVELVKWVLRALPNKKGHWIKRRIRLFDDKITLRSNRLQHFITDYLELDGVFMLRLIANNASDFVATDLIKSLWEKHYKSYQGEICKDDFEDNKEAAYCDNSTTNLIRKRVDFKINEENEFLAKNNEILNQNENV